MSALLTIEGEDDDIVAPGQTYIAHALCSMIPEAMRAHHFQPATGHLGLFHGVVWRRVFLPRLRAFKVRPNTNVPIDPALNPLHPVCSRLIDSSHGGVLWSFHNLQ